MNLANENLLEEPFFWLPSLEGPTITDKLELDGGRGLGWLTEGWTGNLNDMTLTPLLGWHDTLAYIAIPIFLAVSQSVSMRIMSPPTDTDDPSTQRIQGLLKYIPLMLGYFALQVPASLCVYWVTSNSFSTLTTLSIKKYFELNPPDIEWDYLEQSSLGNAAFDVKLPASMDEAILEARANRRPSRASRRMDLGIVGFNAPEAPKDALESDKVSVEDIIASP